MKYFEHKEAGKAQHKILEFGYNYTVIFISTLSKSNLGNTLQ